jgi:hypothetical protein
MRIDGQDYLREAELTVPTIEQALSAISEQAPQVAGIAQQVSSPDMIDRITASHGLTARLYNFYLATRLTQQPLGEGLHVPVQISQRSGGRESLYFLQVEEETIAGTFITSSDIFDWHVRRLTGSTPQAQTGDIFETWHTKLDGSVADTPHQYTLRVLDENNGIGVLEGSFYLWILWSCIRISR